MTIYLLQYVVHCFYYGSIPYMAMSMFYEVMRSISSRSSQQLALHDKYYNYRLELAQQWTKLPDAMLPYNYCLYTG